LGLIFGGGFCGDGRGGGFTGEGEIEGYEAGREQVDGGGRVADCEQVVGEFLEIDLGQLADL
jgi:hypothetical protein